MMKFKIYVQMVLHSNLGHITKNQFFPVTSTYDWTQDSNSAIYFWLNSLITNEKPDETDLNVSRKNSTITIATHLLLNEYPLRIVSNGWKLIKINKLG